MDDNVKQLLDERITKEFTQLDSMKNGEDKNHAVNNLAVLYKLRLEEEKIDVDFDEKYYRRELEDRHHDLDGQLREKQIMMESEDRASELDFKKDQLNEQRIDRWVNLGMQVGISLMSIMAYDCWYRKGLKFEESGTITSPMIRQLLSKLLPSKKQ